MTIIERVNNTLALRGILKKSLCASIGISASTLSTWIAVNNDSIPSEYVKPIADFLGMSCDELLTGEPDKRLDESESRLVDIYRSVDWDGKQIILAAAVHEKRRMEQ